MSDVFTIQSDVAQHIAEALSSKLSPAEKQRIEKIPTQNLEAYDFYLKGREHLNRLTKTDNSLAIELLEKSVTLDPSFALGYAGLSEAYSASVIYAAPESIYETAIEISKKAIALDPNLAEGYEALGYVYQFKGWHSKAIEMEKKALELNPNYARAAGILGKVLWLSGRLDEAFIWVKKYQKLDPTSPLSSRYVGDVNRLLGNISEAKKWYQHGMQLDPNYRESYANLIMTHQLYGSYADVKPLEQKLLNIAPDEPATFETLRNAELFFGHYQRAKEYDDQIPADWKDVVSGYLLWKEGEAKEAEALFSKLKNDYEVSRHHGAEGVSWDYAAIFAIQDDKRSAYEYLDQALKNGFIENAYLEKTPLYENLRNDAEFQRIVAGFKAKADQMRKRAEEQNL